MLAQYLKKGFLDFDTAMAMQIQAERQFADNEFTVSSMDVLALASESGCSTYDCEFVSLAKSLNLRLVTGDRKRVSSFPETALTPRDWLH